MVEKHRAISSRPAQVTTRGRGSNRGTVNAMTTGRGAGPIGSRGNRRGPPKDKMDQLAAYFV